MYCWVTDELSIGTVVTCLACSMSVLVESLVDRDGASVSSEWVLIEGYV